MDGKSLFAIMKSMRVQQVGFRRGENSLKAAYSAALARDLTAQRSSGLCCLLRYPTLLSTTLRDFTYTRLCGIYFEL